MTQLYVEIKIKQKYWYLKKFDMEKVSKYYML
jgi:hypothetical protein